MASSTTYENTAGGSTKLLYNDTSANDYIVELPKETGKLTTEAMAVKLGALGKNYLINGNFDRWDYATNQTTSGYGSDNRWINLNNVSTKTHSQVACTDTERALFNATFFSRTVATSVVGASNFVIKYQNIENVIKLAGKTITISFWAKADASKNIAVELAQNFGTGGTPSAQVIASSQLVSLTSTWQKKTITVTLPSIVGKTFGTDGVHTSYTQLVFWFDAGSAYAIASASLGQQSGTFDIAEVKLEEGSVATPWTPYEGEFGGEVQACARYLPIIGNNSYHVGQCAGAGGGYINIIFKVKPRIPSTGINLIGTIANSTLTNSTAVSIPLTAIAFNQSTLESSLLLCSVASGLVAGNTTLFNVGTNYILFTGCEL